MSEEMSEEEKQKLYQEEVKKMNRMMDLFYMADAGLKKNAVNKPPNKYDGKGRVTKAWKEWKASQ